jgi:hypothetical protein
MKNIILVLLLVLASGCGEDGSRLVLCDIDHFSSIISVDGMEKTSAIIRCGPDKYSASHETRVYPQESPVDIKCADNVSKEHLSIGAKDRAELHSAPPLLSEFVAFIKAVPECSWWAPPL